MVFNRKDLTKAFSPTKLKNKVVKRRSGGTLGNSKPSTSGSTAKMKGNIVSETNIKVIVRLRPPNERENQENFRTVIKVIDERMLVFDPKEEENPFFYRGVAQKGRDLLKKQNKELQFVFDRVFDTYSSNTDVFEGSTKDLINGLLDGYNCSVFAYGATGAGKTHTMLGKDGDPGITYRTMAELFNQIEAQKETREFNLGVSYLEIYNENVQDLLHKVGPLHLREDGRAGVIVAGLKIIPIYSADELLSLLAKGNKNRTQHATDANQESSRSHAVFQVYININNKLDGQVKHVKLSMIDLAGSERASATGCKGLRFKEGANINKSLLALGNCINNLADGIKHIPYRDSKLTRLLKDSLGGNCRTVMIANIGPSSSTFEDTYNTLRYANRAKKIKTTVKKNIVSCEIHISGYVKMVEEQKKEIEMLKQKLLSMQNDNVKQSIQETTKISEETKKISIKLEGLYERKRLLNEKILSLESQDKIMYCRILYKKAADKRLHNLTSAIDVINAEEQNASGKSRVNKSLQYFKRQREGIRIQIKSAWEELCQVEENIKELNKELASKNLESYIADKLNLFNCKIDKTRSQQQVENAKKIISLQQCENESMYRMVGMMSTTLQKFYNTMRGSGTITEKLKLEFKELVKSLEGIRNIKWSDVNTTKEEEDFYTITNLSVQNLENPCLSNIPILLDISSDLEEPKINDCHQNTDITNIKITPSKELDPAAREEIMNTTITINSEPMDEDLIIESASDNNKLNCTFNIQESKANKRKLTNSDSKNQLYSKPTPAKTKKISPKQGKPTVLTVQNGKENNKEQKPVLSENSIKLLNKIKAERLKPIIASTINDEQSDSKLNKNKERRGINPPNSLNQKNNLSNKKTLPAWQF